MTTSLSAQVFSLQEISGILTPRQQEALEYIKKYDTVKSTNIWPEVNPELFWENVRYNIIYPSKLYQGRATNFCAYTSVTHILLRTDPLAYAKMIVDLYTKGETFTPTQEHIIASKEIKKFAGTIAQNGELDIHPADQLWLMSMADHFKSYINFFNQHYDAGDENTTWASTVLAKGSRIARKLTGYTTKTVGSDFIRPWKNDYASYLADCLSRGQVILYINNKFLHPVKYTAFKLRMPTHFMVLYDIHVDENGLIIITYWDYGLKTQQVISKKRLRKLIFGIITITQPATHEK